jgi:uncharacterized short protein YbdD (DUF466 family)
MTGSEEDLLARSGHAATTSDSAAGLYHRPSTIHHAGQECPERRQVGGLAQVSHVAPAWLAGNYLWRGLWVGWRFLRQVSGDDAYERYLQHVARFHPEQTPMSRAEHFRFRQEQKWNRVSRCC